MRLTTALLLAACVSAQPPEMKLWEVFELDLKAQSRLASPYLETLREGAPPYLTATFRNGELSYLVAGFWDGDNNWKIRFAPPAPGEWGYETHSADPGLDGHRGRLLATAWSEEEKRAVPTRRGLIHVSRSGPRTGRYFEYSDGTPFLWIGDTWWAWSKKGIYFTSFEKLADDRAAKGFSVGQLYFAGDWLLSKTRDEPDLEQIRKVEEMIRYANRKGITVWIHAWWSGKHFAATVKPDQARRWWRYVIHRLAAYNVIWVLAGEYNMDNYGGMGLAFWKELGALIKREDPYQRIVSAHPTPPLWSGGAQAPQWSTGEVLHREKWLDYNQIQVGHGRSRNEMIPLAVRADYQRRPPKPVVVTEPWYEFVPGAAAAEDIRFGAWSAILSGAAGHSYGGGHVWWAHVPEAPAKQGAWPLEESFQVNTLDYPGASSIAFLAGILRSLEWWRLEPHPELVINYAAPYCLAVPGKKYVAYLRWGGQVQLNLQPSSSGDVFEYQWFDLTGNRLSKSGTVNGGGIREFSTPEAFPRFRQSKDWLLIVTRAARAGR